MQGRSIGSKRFKVGEAAPQPTLASIYQEDNTPLDWAAPHDRRAQPASPRRPAELHPRALRHGLIASQLGLPMLARAGKKQASEDWEQPAAESDWQDRARAAYSGASERAGDEHSFNEQTTLYDEWELQKELVTYQETYPGYDPGYEEHPRLDFQLPPVAAAYESEHDQRHELDYAQAAYAPAEYAEHDQEHAGSPGSYPYAQKSRHGSQPSAALWRTEQPIRRVQAQAAAQPVAAREHATHVGAGNAAFAAQARAAQPLSATQRAAATAPPPRTATAFAAHARVKHAHTGNAQNTQASPRSSVQTRAPRPAVRRYGDDEPVVYPHPRSWWKRVLFLLALAGAGYAGHRYYLQRAPAPNPTPPPPPAAMATAAEPPPATSEATEDAPASPVQALPESPQSAKQRRSAERRALIAERWRERRAARRARSENSSSEQGGADRNDRSYGSASSEHERSEERDDYGASSARGSEPRDDYSVPSHADRARESSTGAERSASTNAHDDYVSDRRAAARRGVLRINSLPWSQIHIDGQLVGHTPQMNLLLPAGKHRVTLVNPEMQLSKTLTVQITAGSTTTHTIRLAE